jgi:hypothetical protein
MPLSCGDVPGTDRAVRIGRVISADGSLTVIMFNASSGAAAGGALLAWGKGLTVHRRLTSVSGAPRVGVGPRQRIPMMFRVGLCAEVDQQAGEGDAGDAG